MSNPAHGPPPAPQYTQRKYDNAQQIDLSSGGKSGMLPTPHFLY